MFPERRILRGRGGETLAACLLVLLSSGATRLHAQSSGNQSAGIDEIRSQGAAIYHAHCESCHEGQVANAPTRSAMKELGLKKILAAITDGDMKEQASGLAQSEKNALVSYLSGGFVGTFLVPPSPAQALYRERCASCHEGQVARAPSLAGLSQMTPDSILAALGDDGPMKQQALGLTPAQKNALAIFLGKHAVSGVPVSGGPAVLNSVIVDPCMGQLSRATFNPKPEQPHWNGWGVDIGSIDFSQRRWPA